jgi:hypothetical protein
MFFNWGGIYYHNQIQPTHKLNVPAALIIA